MPATNASNIPALFVTRKNVPKTANNIPILFFFRFKMYRIRPKNLDRQEEANTVDPDQTQQNTASDQGLHYLSFI